MRVSLLAAGKRTTENMPVAAAAARTALDDELRHLGFRPLQMLGDRTRRRSCAGTSAKNPDLP